MKLPTAIEFHNKSKVMNISFPDGDYEFTYEFLRVFSPSAEVRGHTPDEAKLQVGKRDVTIVDIQPVGEYALKLTFSDGHDSGIYSWDWFDELGKNQETLWSDYLADLKAHGASRDPNDPANEPFKEKPKSKCSGH